MAGLKAANLNGFAAAAAVRANALATILTVKLITPDDGGAERT
jgi:hypothetical protein